MTDAFRLCPLVLLLLAACESMTGPAALLFDDSGSLPELAAQPPSIAAGDLLLSASAGLVGDPERPPQVYFAAMARNTTAQPINIDGVCIVQIRAAPASSSPSTADWRSPQQPNTPCESRGSAGEIPAGGKYSLSSAGDFWIPTMSEILGDSLPSGEYLMEVVVRVDGETITVPAGAVPLSSGSRPPLPDPRALTYAVATKTSKAGPAYLETTVVATNTTDRYVYLEFGHCSLRLQAFRTADRSGPPVWRSERRQPPGTNGGYVCLGYLATHLVGPGQVISPPEFSTRIPTREILGDSLPDGRYYFAATLDFLHTSSPNQDREVLGFPAGAVDLTSTPIPLAEEWDVGGMLYKADLERTGTNDLRARVSATNTTPEPVLVMGGRSVSCPVQLLGFSDESRRDGFVPGLPVDWAPRSCPLEIPPTWIGAGETETFVGTVEGSAMAAGFGSYYFSVHLRVEQEPNGESAGFTIAATMR